jgi:phosphate transport system substrate-binding protein
MMTVAWVPCPSWLVSSTLAPSRPEACLTKNTGSGDGTAALVDGRCQIATVSRFMKAEEFRKAVDKGVMPVARAIALDAVCVIVHPSNPLTALTV